MTTISLPPNIEITDAYEEIQVLHSFRIESADGKVSLVRRQRENRKLVADPRLSFPQTFLFYCDSEADKEVVVEAVSATFHLWSWRGST